jgi:lipid-A-disaccharide synthase
MGEKKRILIVAGETSGDLHGASLVSELKRMDPELSFAGIGGDRMVAEGVEVGYHVQDLAVVGTVEVFSVLPRLIQAYRWLIHQLKKRPPQVVVLIDYAEFNLFFAGRARKYGVPVIFYISPQVWAWRKRRVKRIARNVEEMVVILPFEKDFYENHGVKVSFVGHPLVDRLHNQELHEELTKETQAVGWMPGSRDSEVNRLLPVMAKAAAALDRESKFPLSHIVPAAPGISPQRLAEAFHQEGITVEVRQEDSSHIMQECDLIVMASGTATLEAALLAVPAVIVYKVSFISYLLGKLLIRVPWIGLANIVAGREIYPELIQYDATPEKIVAACRALLDEPERLQKIRKDLKQIREKLGKPGASQRTAEVIYRYVAAIPA